MMNGPNFFYKKDGTGVPEQFWNESGPLSAAAPAASGTNQGKSTFSEFRVNGSGNSNGSSARQYSSGMSGPAGYQNVLDMRQYQQQAQPQYHTGTFQASNVFSGSMLGGSASSPSSPQPGSGISKKRVARACDHCRKRKIKCDPVNPETQKCTNCTRYNARCTFKVREEIEKRRRGRDLSETGGSGPEDSSVLGFAGTSNAGVAPQLGGVYTDDQMYQSISQSTSQKSNERVQSPDVDEKIKMLDNKVSSISKSLKNVENLLSRLVGSKVAHKDDADAPRPKVKRYYTNILTPHIISWVDKKLNTYEMHKSITTPINEILMITLKWQMIQNKTLTDFATPIIREGKFQLHPLPPQAQAQRIMESFRSAMLVSSAPGLVAADYYTSLVNDFYSGKALSYAELLLLHISISFGAARMRVLDPGDSYTLRKDRYDPTKEELQTIECDSLLNAMYYYNKVSIGGPSLKATQGLMLLSLHLRETRDTSLAFGVFTTALKFAFDLGLHQRFSYLNVTLEEEIIRRSVWWHCNSADKWFSLTQSRPALINDQDMDMLSDQNYFDYLRRLLRLKGSVVAEDVEKMTDLPSCLDYVINYCDLLPIYVSYFSLRLARIEGKVAHHCFSARSTIGSSVDSIIDQLLILREELNDWDNNLHPSMQLSSYKSYLSLLYVRDAADNPALTYEVACSRVARCHFRRMHTAILLGLFALSFLTDNANGLEKSHHSISSIYRLFLTDNIGICMRMLRVFATVDYERHLYTSMLHCLLTGVFALILYVIKYSEEEERHKLIEILDLLVSCHSNLVGENEEYLLSDNPKWNTSIFFYTILLSGTIHYYQEHILDTKFYALNLESYDNMLRKILNHSDVIKNRSLDRLIFYTKCFESTEHQTAATETSGRTAYSRCNQLRYPSFSSYVGSDDNTLSFLRSSEPFKVLSRPTPGYKDLEHQIFTDGSLFRTESPHFRSSFDSFSINCLDQDAKDDIPPLTSATDANDRSNDAQELFYPYALFYDRDLIFSNLLAERLVSLNQFGSFN